MGIMMDKIAIEKMAKKYKKFFERFAVMPFVFKDGINEWVLVEYKKYKDYDNRTGLAMFPEVQLPSEKKREIMFYFASVFGGLMRMRENVLPRIQVTEEVIDTFNKANRLLEDWANDEKKREMAVEFKVFTEFILWCQNEKNEKYQIINRMEEKLFENYNFTREDRDVLFEVIPHFDVIIFLQTKRQEEQLDHTRKLLEALKKEKGNLSRENVSYLERLLDTYCNKGAVKTLKNALDKMPSWREVPARAESYEGLLKSSIKEYAKREQIDVENHMRILRN